MWGAEQSCSRRHRAAATGRRAAHAAAGSAAIVVYGASHLWRGGCLCWPHAGLSWEGKAAHAARAARREGGKALWCAAGSRPHGAASGEGEHRSGSGASDSAAHPSAPRRHSREVPRRARAVALVWRQAARLRGRVVLVTAVMTGVRATPARDELAAVLRGRAPGGEQFVVCRACMRACVCVCVRACACEVCARGC